MSNPHANHQGEPGDTGTGGSADTWPQVFGGWAHGFAHEPYDLTRRGVYLKHQDGREENMREDAFLEAHPEHPHAAFIRAMASGQIVFHTIPSGYADYTPVTVRSGVSAPNPPDRIGEEVGRELERLSRAIIAEIASDRDEAGRLAKSGDYSSANYWNAHASGLEDALTIIREGDQDESADAESDLDWLLKEVIELCEDTEAKIDKALAKRSTNEQEIGFYRGRAYEAKGIRRAISDVVRARKANGASAPSPGAGGDLAQQVRQIVREAMAKHWDDEGAPHTAALMRAGKWDDVDPVRPAIEGGMAVARELNARSGKLVASTGSEEETKGATPMGSGHSRAEPFGLVATLECPSRGQPEEMVLIYRIDCGEYWLAFGQGTTPDRSEAHIYPRSWAEDTIRGVEDQFELRPVGVALAGEAEGRDRQGSVHEHAAPQGATP